MRTTLKSISIALLAFIFSIQVAGQGASQAQNYIITATPLDATDAVTITNGQVSTSGSNVRTLVGIQYFDGLGRPMETVQQGITPTHSDLVSLTEYDPFGRDYKHWLPTPFASNNGAYVSASAFTSAATGTSEYNNDSNPFTQTVYEASPLNRVLAQQGAGAAWTGRAVSTGYQTNTNEVAYFYVNSNGHLQRNGNYSASDIYKTKTTDEDSKTATEYKDKLGRVVMKQSSDDAQMQTYFVYNDLGQLSYVLPPLAATALTASVEYTDDNASLKQYAYLYTYDERGNMVTKRLPGCDPIYMVYDQANRLILSQDGNQRITNKWTISKYDGLGRLLYTGLITRNATLQVMHDLIQNMLIVEQVDASGGFANTGYTCTYFTGEVTPLTVNYYDNYSFLDLIPANKASLSYVGNTNYDKKYDYATGLLTGTRSYILDGSANYLSSAVYYDCKGKAIQSRATNYLGGYDIVYNTLTFTGAPLKTYKEHSIAVDGDLPPKTELYTYTYDHAGRVLTTTYQLNGQTPVQLASQTYDALGRVTVNARHNATDNVSYAYNIRNQLTQLNSGSSFAEKLYYNSNLPSGASAYYNGNISYSTWTYNGAEKGYVYTYDALNRLISAAFKKGTSTQNDNDFSENFSYNNMGNITNLNRAKDGTDIDDLDMTYTGNQLKAVTDNAGTQNQYAIKEYQDLAAAETEFIYDANGNMIEDLDRGIATIRYNILNLPDMVQFSNGNQIINTYAADGRKLKTDYNTLKTALLVPICPGDVALITDPSTAIHTGTVYLDNYEYDINEGVNTLAKVYNTQGYYDINNSYYNYYHQDHLGNNREVWRISPSLGGVGEVIQSTQYYPSGLPWAEAINADLQQRKYNGKEFIQMHGYDTYDYGARGYYPATGRFTTVDPLAEKCYSISPYAYCENNPIMRIDPDGKLSGGPYDFFVNADANYGETQKTDEDIDTYLMSGTKDFEDSKAFDRQYGSSDNTGYDDSSDSQDPKKYYLGKGGGESDKEEKKDPSLEDLKKSPPDHPEYESPKSGDRKVRNPNGKGTGWVDSNGRVWVPDDHNGTHAPHWDRQEPKGGGYTKIYPYVQPAFDPSMRDRIGKIVGLSGTALTIYIIISEGSRLFPPRNLIPVP